METYFEFLTKNWVKSWYWKLNIFDIEYLKGQLKRHNIFFSKSELPSEFHLLSLIENVPYFTYGLKSDEYILMFSDFWERFVK